MDGVLLIKNFISCEEEKYLLSNIEYANWKPSQSGRRKQVCTGTLLLNTCLNFKSQDYGPQVNFKRKKINLNSFLGLPKYIDLLLTRMKENKSTNKKLVGFIPVELCNLEYTAEVGGWEWDYFLSQILYYILASFFH
jgi:alkylated DNA repair protein alkB family protein 4